MIKQVMVATMAFISCQNATALGLDGTTFTSVRPDSGHDSGGVIIRTQGGAPLASDPSSVCTLTEAHRIFFIRNDNSMMDELLAAAFIAQATGSTNIQIVGNGQCSSNNEFEGVRYISVR